MSVFDGINSQINARRSGSNLDPFVAKSESLKCSVGRIVLNEIPNKAAGITFTSGGTTYFVNDYTLNQLPTPATISVDWNNGVCYCDPALEGLIVLCVYTGEGVQALSASRVFTQQSNGVITQTLADVVAKASSFQSMGTYNNTTLYSIFNIVLYLGTSYICTASTSLGNLPTNPSFWNKLAGNNYLGTYSGSTSYNNGDTVINATSDTIYVSIVDGNIGQALTNTAKWTPTISVASAISSANSATSAANSASSSANSSASAASTAAGLANTAAGSANSAASSATSAATLANNTASALVNRGTYSGSTSYSINNVVFYQGVSYMCIVAGTGNTPSSSSTFWSRMNGFVSQGQWNSGITYSVTHVVYDSVNQNLYMSLVDNNLNQALTDTSKWQLLLTISPLILNTKHFGAYNSGTSYVQNNVVSYNGSSYMNILACQNVLPTVTTNWQLIGSQGIQGIQGLKGNQWRSAYSGATSYVVDDVVFYNGSSFICILASLNNLPTNTTYFSPFAQKGADGAGTVSNITSTDSSITISGTSAIPDLSVANAPVIAKVLTGYVSGAGTVSATDSILQAIQKLNGNDATNANLTGDVTSVGNATTIGTSKITSSMIVDGAIVNADINASAAIDATKIANGSVTSAEFQYLGNVTSDIQTQLNAKSPIASPTFTGVPAAPTALAGTNTTQLATTAYVTLTDNKIGILTSLTTTAKTDLVSAVNEVQTMPVNTMYRQAIINGNFDVAQRGTSVTYSNTNNTFGYGLDRWWSQSYGGSTGSGTGTIIQSQQSHTVGQSVVPNNPKFFMRVNHSVLPTQGGTGTVLRSQHRIENVYSFAGRTVSLSFWAKADTSRTILTALTQNFGSGGSPSASVDIVGSTTTFNLTTAWQQFTTTFTIPSISGKTIGSNNDDYLAFAFIMYKLDNTIVPLPSGVVGTYATGLFDFSQIQMNDGLVALPFQPKSFADEFLVCQRYYQRGFHFKAIGTFYNATTASISIALHIPMRVAGTLSRIGTSIGLDDVSSGLQASTTSFLSTTTTTTAAKFDLAGFTAANTFRFARLNDDSIQVDAEL